MECCKLKFHSGNISTNTNLSLKKKKRRKKSYLRQSESSQTKLHEAKANIEMPDKRFQKNNRNKLAPNKKRHVRKGIKLVT